MQLPWVQADAEAEAAADGEEGQKDADGPADEADKEEWQQIVVPIEWQPRPMFKVSICQGHKGLVSII